MKTRDKLKYGFAALLAMMTIIGIGGLMLARHHRQQVDREEATRIQQAISEYGVNGSLPKKVKLPDPPAGVISPNPQ